MPRIAKSDVHAALERAARHIEQAAGSDGRVSRADIQTQLKDLKGTERKLVDMFFRFIDHRDHAPGAVVTKKDVQRAVTYAKQKLIDQYDLNNNGLSQSEIARMSLTGRLAVELARELKAAAAAPPPDPGPGDGGGLSADELEGRARRMYDHAFDESWVDQPAAAYLARLGASDQLPLVEALHQQYLGDVVSFLNDTLARSASWGVDLPAGLQGHTVTRDDLVNGFAPLEAFCDEYQIAYYRDPEILELSEDGTKIGASIQYKLGDDMALSTWTLFYDFEAQRFTARALFDGSAGMGDSWEMLPAGD